MGIDGDNGGDEWRAHRPECVCVGVVTTTTTIVTTLRKERRATWFFGLRESTDFFRSLHSWLSLCFLFSFSPCIYAEMVRDTMQVAQYSTPDSPRENLFQPWLRQSASGQVASFAQLFGATCVCTHVYAHTYVNAWTRLFVSRELENAFQRIPRDSSVLKTGLFVEKRELLCYTDFIRLFQPRSLFRVRFDRVVR